MNHICIPETVVTPPEPAKATVKVLHLINGEHFSGAERVQDLLGICLPEFGYAAAFACLKTGRFATERQSRQCPLYEVPMRSKFDRRAIRQLCDIVTQNNYAILHAHTPRSLLVASRVAKKVGRPLVYHVHSPVGRDSTRSLANRINQWVESFASRGVDHFVCVSDSIQKYMAGLGHCRNLLTTVPNGVSVVENVPDRETPTGTWTIGTTALFRPRKGIEVLLEAMEKLKSSGANVRLLAVGPFESEEYENKIKHLAADLGVSDMIEWTGFSNNVNQYFPRMDLFVLPSLFGEGLPMVILEAMAGGVPVVAAEVEGIPQAIRDRVDGLIFEPGNANDLAAQVQRFQSGQIDWQSVRQSALNRQREKFSDRSMALGVTAVYDRVLQGEARGE